MSRRPKNAPQQPQLPSICHRVGELLNDIWKGNVAQMARDLQVSHPAMSRVLAGQIPSGKILQGLAEHPEVNSTWLLSGEDRSPAVAHRTCCIAKQLLPGPPNEYPEKLGVGMLPVASIHPLVAAYWYQVRPEDAVAKVSERQVGPGDYLLIETSPRWTQRPDAYAGRLCVLRLSERAVPVLGQVAENEEYFTEGARNVEVPGDKMEYLLFASQRKKLRHESNHGSEKVELYQEDLVGVCVQLARVF